MFSDTDGQKMGGGEAFCELEYDNAVPLKWHF